MSENRYNNLYRGEPEEAIPHLEAMDAANFELRAAIINALTRIAQLEKQVAKLLEPAPKFRRKRPKR